MNVNQPPNQNTPADGQSRAGEAGANLTDVLCRDYSTENWAHKALLLMDEANALVRHASVCIPADKYTPAAKAFWDVCHMLAQERNKIHDLERHNVKLTSLPLTESEK